MIPAGSVQGSVLPADATKAQALRFLAANFRNRYENAAKTPYNGLDGAQIYALIEKQHPAATPYDIAKATADLLLSSALGQTIGDAVTGTGKAVGSIAKGVSTAQYVPSVPSWASGLTQLLGALGNPNLWIRGVKILVGGALLLIGLAHLTGASNAVFDYARRAPLPV